ncbi:hypothetical protein QZH41_003109 [Actinostola sp. cb2023]|nr:hypothetical protein QZH41_003109 [Actinostola sp. cb2023]
MLFNRKMRGKIPYLRMSHMYDQEVFDRDAEQKAKTKSYANALRGARPSMIAVGDQVLMKQDKYNKLTTHFNAVQHTVTIGIISVVYVTVWIKIKFYVSKRSNCRLLGPGEERNIFFAIGIVTVVFVGTWLPFNIMNLMANFHHSLITALSFDVIFLIKLLHYSNSFINPIVYTLKIPEFRKSVYGLFVKDDWPNKTRETRV